jgi:cysteine-rich repeat protein
VCKNTVPLGCGDGVRGAGEQCDDGNNINLDGCDYTCKFEQNQRTNFVEIQFASDAFCGGTNQIGVAIAAVAQSTFQGGLAQGVTNGTSGVIFKLIALDDLSGQDDQAAALGIVNGAPVSGAGYNGNNDVDWWYTVDPMWLDANRQPLYSLFASFTAGVLDAGPGNILAPNFLSSTPPVVSLSSVKIQLIPGASTAPLMSMGMSPGHLASENIDPALTSFQTASMPDSMGSGKMCADISAASLAQGAIPAQLLPPSMTQCSEGYTAQNSLLDLLVGGCKVGGFIQAINAVQPDKVDPMAPVAGAGGPYNLTTDAAKKVSGCTDKDGASVNLNECLAAAAYSSYFRIATDRVILK